MELNALVVQFLRLLGRGFAVDRAVLDLAVMHLARLIGKLAADVLGIPGEVVAQLLELGAHLAFLRRDHRDGRGGFGRRLRDAGSRRGGRRRCVERHLRPRDARRHDRLFDLGRAADRAGDEPPFDLLVEGGRIGEPALEVVPALADEGVADHGLPPTACRWVGSAAGAATSKRRPCWSEGMRARATAISASAISAMTTAGSVLPSARTRPHGSITSEWPNVSRPFSWRPPCAAAST